MTIEYPREKERKSKGDRLILNPFQCQSLFFVCFLGFALLHGRIPCSSKQVVTQSNIVLGQMTSIPRIFHRDLPIHKDRSAFITDPVPDQRLNSSFCTAADTSCNMQACACSSTRLLHYPLVTMTTDITHPGNKLPFFYR